MNSLERILATITGDDADYQPFTMLLSLYGANLINSDTHPYYRDPELWFRGQQAVVDTFDPDIVISPFALAIEAEAFGSEIVFLNKYAPNVRKPIITDLSQIELLPAPDFNHSNSISFFLKGTDLLSKQYGGKRAIASLLSSPVDLPALLMGIETWIDTLLFHPDAVEKMMEKTVNHFVKLGNEFLERGTNFLVVPVNFTTSMIITDKIFKQLIPYLELAFSQIKGPIVIHNGGSRLIPFIHEYSKLPNVIAFVLGPSESFDEARKIIGDNLILMGNFDSSNFINLTKEKAETITLKILNNRKDDKHFIFATSTADIPYDTPIDTIKHVVEVIRNFKKY